MLGCLMSSVQSMRSSLFLRAIRWIFWVYSKDIRTNRAVERNIEIIGEAVGRILKHSPDIAIENARNIVGTRNRIIHIYDSIADDLIGSIVVHSLPKLKAEVQQLLA